MDRFITRTLLPPRAPPKPQKIIKHRQLKIQSLARVVDLKAVEDCKHKLMSKGCSRDDKISSLERLKDFPLTTTMISTTEIGYVVGRLRKSEDEEIRQMACDLVAGWKGVVAKEKAPKVFMEVKAGGRHEMLRKKTRELLVLSLKDSLVVTRRSNRVREEEMFQNERYKSLCVMRKEEEETIITQGGDEIVTGSGHVMIDKEDRGEDRMMTVHTGVDMLKEVREDMIENIAKEIEHELFTMLGGRISTMYKTQVVLIRRAIGRVRDGEGETEGEKMVRGALGVSDFMRERGRRG